MAGSDNLVQQRRHPVVESRVVEVFLDDLTSDVVLDGLGNRSLTALDAIGHVVDAHQPPWSLALVMRTLVSFPLTLAT
jgi:hypothetical protein